MTSKNRKVELQPIKAVKSITQNNQIRKRKNNSGLKKGGKNVDKGFKRKLQKKLAVQMDVPTIKSVIPKAYPLELTVEVSNLPLDVKQIDIIDGFSKYGRITYVQNISKRHAIVAFLKQEEANAAVAASKTVRISDRKLIVKKRSKKIKEADESAQRKIFVFGANPSIGEDDIKKHFEACGKILSVKSMKRAAHNYFLVEFADKAAGKAALSLHNSILKDSMLSVRLQSNQYVPWYPSRTIVLLNENALTKLEGSVVKNIFENFGEIENWDVLCGKQKLAVVTFKHEEDATKALILNGKNQNGLSIAVELYATELLRNSVPARIDPHAEKLNLAKAKKRSVYVKKVAEDVTEEDLKDFFASCGSVKMAKILPIKGAVIEFIDSDGYCNAFALHGLRFKGQKLYLAPFSENPQKTLSKSATPNLSGEVKKIKKEILN